MRVVRARAGALLDEVLAGCSTPELRALHRMGGADALVLIAGLGRRKAGAGEGEDEERGGEHDAGGPGQARDDASASRWRG